MIQLTAFAGLAVFPLPAEALAAQGMDPLTKDEIQIAFWAVAIVGGLISAALAIHQRWSEHRWRKADATRELLREIHDHPFAIAAVRMLDWRGGSLVYEVPLAGPTPIGWTDILAALSKPREQCSSTTERFVWDAFDWFFYYVDRIEQYIEAGLLDARDIRPVFQPYEQAIQESRTAFTNLVERQGYYKAQAFFGI